jgi:hypothetical protein
MAQSIVRRPFQELDARDDEWIQPAARNHFRRRETLTPPPSSAIGQITERAVWYLQLLETRQQDPTEL